MERLKNLANALFVGKKPINKILKNEGCQRHLEKHGFVVLDLLDHESLNEYLSQLEDIKDLLPFHKGIHITMEHADVALRKELSQKLIQMSEDRFSQVFENFQLFQGSFIVKGKSSEENSVGLHQDWTFVDEAIGLESYTLWIALTDISKEMGTISVIAGSHKKLTGVRYTPNEKYDGYSRMVDFAKDKSATEIELKAGQAVLWNHKLIHSSSPNRSEIQRLTMTFGITTKEADLKLYYLSPETDRVSEYNVNKDFYYWHNSSVLHKCYQNKEIPNGATFVKEL